MDIGYVVLLLLVLVYLTTGIFLYFRARRVEPGPEEAPEVPPDEPEAP